MRKLLACLATAALLVAASPAFAGIAIINGGGTGGLIGSGSCASGGSCPTTTTVTSSASTVDVPAGSFVYIGITTRATNAGYTGCTDSAGNSYSTGANKSNPPTAQTLQWNWGITTIDAPIGTTWKCTTGGSTLNRGIMVAAFSGVASSSFHDAASAAATAGSGTVMSVGPTGTLSCPGGGANCEVLLTSWSNHNTGAQSAQTAGFTQFGCITANSANICMAYEIVSATTAQSYTSTNANSDVWAMSLDGYVAATGGGTEHACVIGSGITGC